LAGEITPNGDLTRRKIPGDSDEAKWKNAAITFLTWLYRRDEWRGLSQEGRVAEAAPYKEYARKRLAHIGGENLNYDRRTDIGPEPWWQPPDHILKTVGGTDATCSCGWSGPGHLFAEHAGGQRAAPPWRPAPAKAPALPAKAVPAAASDRLPPSLANVPDVGKATFLAEMGQRHGELTTATARRYAEIWNLNLAQAASEQEARRALTRAQVLLKEVDRYAVTYWADAGVLARADETVKVRSSQPMPGPEWRASLSRRLEYIKEWLAQHGAPSEADRA
jgi:hypothetical protein